MVTESSRRRRAGIQSAMYSVLGRPTARQQLPPSTDCEQGPPADQPTSLVNVSEGGGGNAVAAAATATANRQD